jgi:hypothetical protein
MAPTVLAENLRAVDKLVTNAGTGVPRSWQQVGAAELDEALAVNLRSVSHYSASPTADDWPILGPNTFRLVIGGMGEWPVRAGLFCKQGRPARPHPLLRRTGGPPRYDRDRAGAGTGW